jgi:Ankyrin repeats (3 copies)
MTTSESNIHDVNTTHSTEPAITLETIKRRFLALHNNHMRSQWFSFFRHSGVNDTMNIQAIVAHAQGNSPGFTGQRSYEVLLSLAYMNQQKQVTGTLKTLLESENYRLSDRDSLDAFSSENETVSPALPPIEEGLFNNNPMLVNFLDNYDKKLDNFGNTPLTKFIAERVYGINEAQYNDGPRDEIIIFIRDLCELAKSDIRAQYLLTKANQTTEFSLGLTSAGYPINTPLMLLVKTGDLEAVNMLLPFYESENLMKTSPRGNNPLHIASITGQIDMIKALEKRALELGILEALQEQKSIVGKTAPELLEALYQVPRSSLFDYFLDFANPQLGGEEINKAVVGGAGKKVFQVRQEIVRHARELGLEYQPASQGKLKP